VDTVIPVLFTAYWTRPVKVTYGVGCKAVVRGPWEALRFMSQVITHQHGPNFAKARRRCHAAIRNDVSTDAVRADFVAAYDEWQRRLRPA
jgi:hypothetical protein